MECERIAFAGQNGEEEDNIDELLDKRKVPENLQTAVSSEYQRLSKGPQNSRISERRRSWWISNVNFKLICKDFSEE